MKKILSIVALLCSLLVVSAQNGQAPRLKVFLEGGFFLDFNFVRNNTTFVDFVNDASVADVHIIVSRQNTGGGGSDYSFDFTTRSITQIGDISLSCITWSYDTDNTTREKLLQTLHMGLLPYMNARSGSQTVSVKVNLVEQDTENEGTTSEDDDPWRQWVFTLDARGGFSGEEKRKNYDMEFSFRARKVTEQWKADVYYDYERNSAKITRSNGDITRTLRLEQQFDLEYVYSLGPRWSAGAFLNGEESTYNNIDKALSLRAALQYNFFPWEESDRRRFTFTYNIGPKYSRYTETTIFLKDREWLWEQTLGLNYDRIEPWGSVYSWLDGGIFFLTLRTISSGPESI